MDLLATLLNHKNRCAFTQEDGSEISYQKLLDHAMDLSARIRNEKSLIVVYCKQNIATVIGYLAARLGGHTALLLDNQLNEHLTNTLIATYQPDYLWQPTDDGTQYELVCLNKDSHYYLHPDLSLLLSTSGSTGSPKLVKLSERNLLANATSIIEYLHINQGDRPIISLPFHYSYGLSVLNTHLHVGATILLTESSVTQGRFWRFFKSAGADSFSGVPYTYEMLKRLRFKDMQLHTMRYMTQAGGKMDQELIQYFVDISEQRDFKFYVMYGQTEATARISYLPFTEVREKIGSIGIPIPGGQWWLQDEQKNRIETPNKQGELVYRGPNVMMGYAETLQDLARGDERDGVLETGDLAYFDADGFCYITGRLKRFIKLFGNRYSLDDIQESLSEAGMESVAGGWDNNLLIATKMHDKLDSIRDYLTEEYKIHHSVIKVYSVDDFPIGSNGKLMYGELFARLTTDQ